MATMTFTALSGTMLLVNFLCRLSPAWLSEVRGREGGGLGGMRVSDWGELGGLGEVSEEREGSKLTNSSER